MVKYIALTIVVLLMSPAAYAQSSGTKISRQMMDALESRARAENSSEKAYKGLSENSVELAKQLSSNRFANFHSRSLFADRYVLSEARLSGSNVGSVSEIDPDDDPDEEELREYYQRHGGLEPDEAGNLAKLMIEVDRQIKDHRLAVRDAKISPEMRLQQALAADELRLAQARTELAVERVGDAGGAEMIINNFRELANQHVK